MCFIPDTNWCSSVFFITSLHFFKKCKQCKYLKFDLALASCSLCTVQLRPRGREAVQGANPVEERWAHQSSASLFIVQSQAEGGTKTVRFVNLRTWWKRTEILCMENCLHICILPYYPENKTYRDFPGWLQYKPYPKNKP